LEQSLDKQLLLTQSRIERIKNQASTSEISDKTTQVIEYLWTIRVEMLKLDHQDCKSITELKAPFDNKKGTEYMFETARAFKLREKIEEYKKYLDSKIENDNLRSVIDKHLNTYARVPRIKGEPAFSWESFHFEALPLIQSIINLKLLELEIKTVELIALEHLADQ
jgi:hypothetical protein